MDLEILFRIFLPIIGIAGLVLKILQYLGKLNVRKSGAKRELERLDIERDRMVDRHKQEESTLLADCEGEIRFNEYANMHINTLTAEDKRRFAQLSAEHRRDWDDLLSQIDHQKRILGETPQSFFKEESFLDNLKSWFRKSI